MWPFRAANCRTLGTGVRPTAPVGFILSVPAGASGVGQSPELSLVIQSLRAAFLFPAQDGETPLETGICVLCLGK